MPLNLGTCQAVIVNNSPDDVLLHQLESSTVKILEAHKNVGFGCGCNLALRWIHERAPDALVWIINPDAYLLKDPRSTLHHFFQDHPHLSILGTVIKTFDGDIWFAGGRLNAETGSISVDHKIKHLEHPYWSSDWVSGCSLILNLKLFSECPRFNPNYFLYYEDVEFCRRYASVGHLIAITQDISIFHEPSSITNRNLFLKIRHSTYSYLLTLETFASRKAFVIRFIRLLLNAFYLIFIQPKAALGKFWGTILYVKQRFHHPAQNPAVPLIPVQAMQSRIHAE